MAQAMSEVLRSVLRSKNGTPLGAHTTGLSASPKKAIDLDQVPYFPIREINLDDNGLKD